MDVNVRFKLYLNVRTLIALRMITYKVKTFANTFYYCLPTFVL